jgi:hypothetical protein
MIDSSAKKPTFNAKRIKNVEKLVKLVTTHNLDELEVDGVKIKKSRHTPPQAKDNLADYYKIPSGLSREALDELVNLHWSSVP